MKWTEEVDKRIEWINKRTPLTDLQVGYIEFQMFELLKLHEKAVKNNGVLADVMPSAYIMKLDRETTIVIADNIAEAMDKAEENGAQDYEMSYCRTIPILH